MDFYEFERVLYKGKVERHGKIFNIKINSERIKRILKVKELLGNFYNLKKALDLDKYFSSNPDEKFTLKKALDIDYYYHYFIHKRFNYDLANEYRIYFMSFNERLKKEARKLGMKKLSRRTKDEIIDFVYEAIFGDLSPEKSKEEELFDYFRISI